MMRLQSTILLALTLALSLVSGAPAQPAADALSERQQTCPFGQVVRLWVEERTEINLKGVIDHLKGGPGVYSDFAFSEGDHEQETFALYTYADGADPAGRPTAKYVCYIHAPNGVPGDCFEISVRHAWPIISGGKDTLTTLCVEYPLDEPLPPLRR